MNKFKLKIINQKIKLLYDFNAKSSISKQQCTVEEFTVYS